jgi:glycosyltransferase involved in cell wall biosynthesis
MAKVVYVVLKERPHIGHITWLRAMRALGHEVKLASLQRPRMPINHGDILITEGVRPTAFGITQRLSFRCWAAVANSPSILKPAVNLLYKLPDKVLSVSELVAKLIDNDVFVLHPVPPEIDKLLEAKSVERRPWVCFVGAFIPIKGLHLVPDVAHRLRGEGVRVTFMLIGGTEESRLTRLILRKAETFGVREYIKIVKPLPRAELVNLLRRCSVYLHPSLFDAFPVSVVEAMALGVVPVIAKYVGAAEIVKKVDQSLIREPTPESLADALKTLLENPPLLRELSKRSREAVREALSFRSILSDVETFIRLCV